LEIIAGLEHVKGTERKVSTAIPGESWTIVRKGEKPAGNQNKNCWLAEEVRKKGRLVSSIRWGLVGSQPGTLKEKKAEDFEY